MEAHKTKKTMKKSSLFTWVVQRIVLQWFISVKTCFASSQVFTTLHITSTWHPNISTAYIVTIWQALEHRRNLLSESKAWFYGEELWRGKLPLHANNKLLISEIWYVCEEWRLVLRICEKKIWLNTLILHNFIISGTNTKDYMYE